MKPWTWELITGIVVTTGTGIAIALLMPVPTLMFWITGLMMGYGLRIGIVNVWPDIFRPRMAYESKQATRD